MFLYMLVSKNAWTLIVFWCGCMLMAGESINCVEMAYIRILAVHKGINTGINTSTSVNSVPKLFYKHRLNLSTFNGCLLLHLKVVIPKKYQAAVLKPLHEGYPGMNWMKSLAGLHVWWPSIMQYWYWGDSTVMYQLPSNDTWYCESFFSPVGDSKESIAEITYWLYRGKTYSKWPKYVLHLVQHLRQLSNCCVTCLLSMACHRLWLQIMALVCVWILQATAIVFPEIFIAPL